MSFNASKHDTETERWTGTAATKHNNNTESSRRSSLYRSIQPRPAPDTHINGSIDDTIRPAAKGSQHHLRGWPNESASSHTTAPDLSPTSTSMGLRQTPIPSRTPSAVITLNHAGSDPTPLSSPSIVLSSRRSSAGSTPSTYYFPFPHTRGRVRTRTEASLEPYLLGLPMEARYRIYRLLLIEHDVIEISCKKQAQPVKVPALLQVNRQIREEASYIWYGLNEFTLVVKHGETDLVRTFLAPLASLPSPTVGRLSIVLSTCFQCNDLVAVAALLIASNIAATIKCTRGVYHFGHPKIQPCTVNTMQAIHEQHFRPSVATALWQSSDPSQAGAGFVIEDPPLDGLASSAVDSSSAPQISSVFGYTPTYRVNPSIRKNLENVMGSVGLLLS